MKNKYIICIVSVFFFAASGCGKKEISSVDNVGDSLYYFYGYNGKKQYISLNTKYAYLAVKEPQLPVEIKQRGMKATDFLCDKMWNARYKGKPVGTNRYYTELSIGKNLTTEQYLELLADIKRENGDVIIAPYFNIQRDLLGGPFHVFFVKLMRIEDIVLLEQMAEQMGCDIYENISPLWYRVSVTEESNSN